MKLRSDSRKVRSEVEVETARNDSSNPVNTTRTLSKAQKATKSGPKVDAVAGAPANAKPDSSTTLSLDTINNDVLSIICSYVVTRGGLVGAKNHGLNFSMVNKRIRSACEVYLFRKLCIRGTNTEVSLRLESLAKTRTVAPLVKSLDVRSFPYARNGHSKESIGRDLSRIAKSLTGNLVKMSLVLHEAVADHVRNFFIGGILSGPNLSFPTVKTLVVGQNSGWLIKLCPNIDSFAVDKEGAAWMKDYLDILNGRGGKEMKRLELEAQRWTLDDIGHVFDCMPNATTFALLGSMTTIKMPDLINALSKFEELTYLALPVAKNLSDTLEYFAGGEYEKPLPREDQKWVYQQRGEQWKMVRASVSSELARRLKNLQVCWFGQRHKALIERDIDGNVTNIGFPTVEEARVGLLVR